MTDRLFIESGYSFEEGLTAAINPHSDKGPIYLSIAEEQAVDSYNEHFTCSIYLTIEKAIRLRNWLDEQINETRKLSLADDPRYKKALEWSREHRPQGAWPIIPRALFLEAGFTEEEIDELQLDKNPR